MRAERRTFAEEFERVLVESDTSVRRLARLSGVPRRTLENWLYRYSTGPRYVDPILQVARALQLPAVDTDRLLLTAGHPSLARLRRSKQLPPGLLLEWQLPPDAQKGQKNSALSHAQKLLRQMPWNEELHREVMELLALNDRRSEALKQFGVCRQALRDELGVEPVAETLALHERIKHTAHFSRDNIPAITTPLIGREAELETIARLLADPEVRLVTITGLGGIGKTRLALDIAWRHTEGQFRDGVAFVQLAAVESAVFLIPAIAQALHLPLGASDENQARQQLLDYLKPKQMLLVLDNCEHLLEGIAIAADILTAAPQVQILATSRAYLHLHGEFVFTLQGLAYDEDTADHPAALLFSAAGQRTLPDFVLNDENAAHVNRLCRMVDGMPLALELAAAWLDTMPLASILAEIEESLDFLAADLRDTPPRHHSLRAVLEPTWMRLKPRSRQVLSALSVFRGSFTREAAQEVATASPQSLRQLVAHSLLQFDGEGDRYQLHEMLRQFAAQKLSEDRELWQAVNQRHFVTYNDLAQYGGAAMRGGDQTGWMARLQQEEENSRKALDWAIDNDVESAATLSLALHTFWQISGRNQEALRRYEQLIPHQEKLPPQIRPWLLASCAEILHTLGRSQESTALQSAALPLFLEQEDNIGVAFIYLLRSLEARDRHFIDVSIQQAKTGLQYVETSGTDSYYETLLLEALSDSLTRSGRFEEAEARIQQGYQLCLERSDRMGANGFLAHKAFLADSLGRQAEARRLGEEYLAESRRLGMLQEELTALDHLGILAFADGDLDLAEAYTVDGLALAREAQALPSVASLDINMSEILMAKGAYLEALPLLREALSLERQFGRKSRVAYVTEALSRWAWYCDKQNLNAVRWNASAKARLEASGQLRLPYELAIYARTREDMEASLDEATLTRVWAEGESMPFESALEELLHALPQTTGSRY